MTPTEQGTEKRFRVCDACGRLTPAHLPRCVECGQASVQAMAEAAEREKEERFARTFFTRGAPATFALIGANVAVFILLVFIAKTWEPSAPAYNSALIEFGAKVNSLIDKGQYWRFVTPMFLHVGVIHLLVNMYSLYAVGPQVERLYGTARFLLIYLMSGAAGVGASYLFPNNPNGVSAGASGALFGLLGVLFAFGFRFRSELPGVFRKAFSPRGLVPVLALNLFITFAISFIDKGAHLGGLAAGALLGAIIPYFRTNERRASIVWRTLATISVATTVVCFAFAFHSARPVHKGSSSDLQHFLDVYNRLHAAEQAAFSAVGDAAEGRAAPVGASESARAAATEARSGAGIDDASDDLFERDAQHFDRMADLLARPSARPSQTDVAAVADEHKALDDAWSKWIETNGSMYGIQQKGDTETPGGNDGN